MAGKVVRLMQLEEENYIRRLVGTDCERENWQYEGYVTAAEFLKRLEREDLSSKSTVLVIEDIISEKNEGMDNLAVVKQLKKKIPAIVSMS